MGLLTAEFAKVAAAAHPPRWHRPKLAELRNSRSVSRQDHEAYLLHKVMTLAEKSDVAQAALHWARAHDIEFIIDYTTNAGGYYNKNTGVVAISKRAAEGELGLFYGVEVLVHELRHAWQDHHGLLPSITDYRSADLAYVTIQQAFYEADAHAHGKLASAQCSGEVGNPLAYLRNHFRNWYAGSRSNVYVSHQRRHQAAMLDIDNCQAPDYQIEFKGSALPQSHAGINPWRREDIEKLGKSFAGVNYLATWDLPLFWKRILSPSSALREFMDNVRTDKTADAVRVKQLRQRIFKSRLTRYAGASVAARFPG